MVIAKFKIGDAVMVRPYGPTADEERWVDGYTVRAVQHEDYVVQRDQPTAWPSASDRTASALRSPLDTTGACPSRSRSTSTASPSPTAGPAISHPARCTEGGFACPSSRHRTSTLRGP